MIRGPLSRSSHFLFLSAVRAKHIMLKYLGVILIMIPNKTHNGIVIEFPPQCHQRECRKFDVDKESSILWICEITEIYWVSVRCT